MNTKNIWYLRTSKPTQDGEEQKRILQNQFFSNTETTVSDLGVPGDTPMEDRGNLVKAIDKIRRHDTKSPIQIQATHPDRIFKAYEVDSIVHFFKWARRNNAEFKTVSAIPRFKFLDKKCSAVRNKIYSMLLGRMAELGHFEIFQRKPFSIKFIPLKNILGRVVSDLKALKKMLPTDDSLRMAYAFRVYGAYNELLALINKHADHRGRDPGGWGKDADHFKIFSDIQNAEKRNDGVAQITQELNRLGISPKANGKTGHKFTRDTVRSILASPGYRAYKLPVRVPFMPPLPMSTGWNVLLEKQMEALKWLKAGRNVLVVIRTGYGKTRIALEHHKHLMAIHRSHITIFLVPHKGLAELMCGKYGGIAIFGKISSQENQEKFRLLKEKKEGGLVFIVPDKLIPGRRVNEEIIEAIQNRQSKFLVVDEADCVLEDADYRDAYLNIKDSVAAIRPTQVLAMTATAAQGFVRGYLKANILPEGNSWKVVKGAINRRNLFYQHEEFENITGRKAHIVNIARRALGEKKNLIVYIDRIKQVDRTWKLLRDLDIPAGRYHSEISDEKNMRAIKDFQDGKTRVMVCTSGFGRGIDLQVDFVVVAHTPTNLSQLQQYFGRCARDGRTGYCWWLTTKADSYFLDYAKKSLQCSGLSDGAKTHLEGHVQMIQTATRRVLRQCIRVILLQGQKRTLFSYPPKEQCCSVCMKEQLSE